MLNKLYEELPEYYSTMSNDGYSPQQILMSMHKSMYESFQGADDTMEVVITTKEKIK